MTNDDFRNQDWIMLVKRTREKFCVSIQGAHDLIFADDDVRRLVAARINREPQCYQMAWRDIRENGEDSRFIKDGDKIRFRQSDGQRPA
ncbi:hypothetical protein [Aurantiacibacter gilvus]|uniref:Uncharacterized protein n=1 Tax=Aurantiacibacter gilvus TaxID=3139141 RepID=A0ABU9IER7_9SPHN